MRVALVHEFLTQLGGAERVLQNLFEIWPDAVLHVIIYNKEKTNGVFEVYQKRFSFLNNWPLATRAHKFYLGLMPRAVESFRFDDFDVVLSDSSSFAKGAQARGKLHICYCHTPTRFLWTEQNEYLQSQPYPFFIKWLAKPVLMWLKKWDKQSALEPKFMIANSVNVQKRIKKYYDRDSIVIYPPVDTEFFYPVSTKKDYYLVASRLEPYKKVDLMIEAFNRLGLKLKVAGTGTMLEKLKGQAKSNIEFVGRVPDEELRRLYSESLAYVFPGEEDAGISLLEAQACGTPVLAYEAGGALELVKENESGIFIKEQTAESIMATVNTFKAMQFDPEKIRKHAQQFDKNVFQAKIREFVETKYREIKQ